MTLKCCDETGVKRALFPGSFNPYTVGHSSIAERALAIFDELIIAVGVSVDKYGDAEVEERVEAIKRLYADDSRVKVCCYSGLTVDVARQTGCRFIVRGVRNSADFEYERNMADINRRLSGIETVMLMTLPELSAVSSSVVRELSHFGHDVSEFLPSPPQKD